MNQYGFDDQEWFEAKEQAKRAMAARARVRGMIPYSDLVQKIQAISIAPHDQRLFDMLGEISKEEDAAGRGMLTALVVHKSGDMQPGPGFFELAGSLGRDTSDILKCWIDEVKKVHKHWSNPTKK